MIKTQHVAYLLIICSTDKINDVILHLKSINEVQEIQGTCGAYDIIVKIESNSFDQLRQSTIDKIRKIEYIRSSTILRCGPVS